MQKVLASVFLCWISVSVSVSVCADAASAASGSAAAAAATSGGAHASDPRLDMVTALQALGAHPSLGDQANVFGRFVGTWDGEYTEYSKDGKTTRSLGEWIFGWVMDGRAIQDLFIIHPSETRKERYIGTTLRIFDPKSKTWVVSFIDPENGSVQKLTGGAVGDDRIVLVSPDTDGKESRWSFEEIRADSWIFRDELSRDGGKTWRLVEVDRMKRRVAATAGVTSPASTESLDYFAGRWRCDGLFPASGKSIASILQFERDPTSGALLKRHDDIPPNRYHALELWSFVKAGGLSDTIVERSSGVYPPFISQGWSGDTLTWSSPPGVNPANRYSYVRLAPDRMRVDWSVANAEGEYKIGDTLTCVHRTT